jgi:hypothetical protein
MARPEEVGEEDPLVGPALLQGKKRQHGQGLLEDTDGGLLPEKDGNPEKSELEHDDRSSMSFFCGVKCLEV